MKRIIMLVTVVVLMGVTAVIAAAPAEAAPTQTVRYGPFTIPAASGDVPGTLERVRFGVAKPCQGQDCYITGFKPNLIYPDGSTANVGYVDGMHTGVMLHHALFTNQWRPDATCGTSRTLWGLAG